MADVSDRGPSPQRTARTVAVTLALFLGVALIGLAPLDASRSARAASVTLTLHVNLITGWLAPPIEERNPTIVVNHGDEITVSMTSEDGFEHGLVIDYPDPNPDFESPSTRDTVEFTFTAIIAGQFRYYDSNSFSAHGGTWVTDANEAPSVTIQEPASGTSWTAGVPHDIVFDASDPDEDPIEVVITYRYDGGAVQGTIGGPFTAEPNPNRIPWTPSGFAASDVVVTVAVQDPRGLSDSASSDAFEVDPTAPTIASASPVPGATGVALNSPFRVIWSEAMDTAETGGSGAFGVLTGSAWLAGTVSWSGDDKRMTFQPEGELSPGTLYEVHVNDTARDDSTPGNRLADSQVWTFSTGSAGDRIPPTILAVSANPAEQVPGGFVNLTADVEDEMGVSYVTALISGPGFNENLTMAHASGTRWYLERSYSDVGHYDVGIWAADVGGNVASHSAGLGFDISSSANPVLPTPGFVSAKVTDGVVDVTWSPVSFPGLSGYHVYRGGASTGPFERLTVSPLPASGPSVHHDGSVQSGRTYYYTVTAVNSTGAESPYAPRSSVTIPPYQNSPIFEPIPWAIAGVTLALILGAFYGTVWRRKPT